jgi:hypothetical protein
LFADGAMETALSPSAKVPDAGITFVYTVLFGQSAFNLLDTLFVALGTKLLSIKSVVC